MVDVLEGGSTRPPWRPPRWLLVAAGALAVAGAVIAAIVIPSSGQSSTTTPAPSLPTATAQALPPLTCPSPPSNRSASRSRTVGLLLMPQTGHTAGYPYVARESGSSHVRWSTIIRRSAGSLGKDEVVITFPAAHPTSGTKVDIAGQPGRVGLGTVTWATAGSYATLRGDLPTDELTDIARHVVIRNRRPVLQMPGAGLTTAATVPFTPPTTYTVRYDSARGLGAAGRALAGLVFTGVAQTAALDDWILDTHPSFAGQVRGAPAVTTSLFGGNSALAWELRPGTIAYVGYSGAESSDRTTQALLCLAEWSRRVDQSEWQTTVAHRRYAGR